MLPPSNPKKQSLMPAGKLRKLLRAAGHHRPVIVQVGKEGVTEPVLKQLEEALLAHELVKVKVGSESPEDRFEVGAIFAAEPGVQLAQILGRTLLVYRKHAERPKFEPGAPRPKVAVKARPAPARRAPPRRVETRRTDARRGEFGRPGEARGDDRRPGPKRFDARRMEAQRGEERGSPPRRDEVRGPPARRGGARPPRPKR